MAQTFQCPNCGAALDFDGGDDPVIRCAYCNSAVIVPEDVWVRDTPAAAGHSGQSWTGGMAAFSMDMDSFAVDLGGWTEQVLVLKEVKNLVHDGEKERAAGLYQETFSVDAAQAAAVIDRLAKGESVVISSTTTTFHQHIPTVSGTPYGVLPPTPEAQAKFEAIMSEVNEAQKQEAQTNRAVTLGLLIFFVIIILVVLFAVVIPFIMA